MRRIMYMEGEGNDVRLVRRPVIASPAVRTLCPLGMYMVIVRRWIVVSEVVCR